jgi:hypothetical protein
LLLLLLLLLLQVSVPRPHHAAVQCTKPEGLEPRGDELYRPPRQQADATRHTAAATRTQLVCCKYRPFSCCFLLVLLVILSLALSIWLSVFVSEPCGDELYRPPRQQADTTSNTAAATSTQLVCTNTVF